VPARYEPVTPDWNNTGGRLPATTIVTARLTDEDLRTLDDLAESLRDAQTFGRRGRYTRSAALRYLIEQRRTDVAGS
jgi:hypothetical protein